MDTAQTVVQDTIYNVTHAYDTVQPELIEVYEKLITTQENNFDNILVAIGIVVTTLVVLISVFNLTIARHFFKKDAKKIYKKQRIQQEEALENRFERLENLMDAKIHDLHAATLVWDKKTWIFAIKSLMHKLEIVIEYRETEEIFNYLKTVLQHFKNINKENLRPVGDDFDYEESKRIVEMVPDKSHFEEIKAELLNEIEKLEERHKK